jgi:peroxiredoxin-like protein
MNTTYRYVTSAKWTRTRRGLLEAEGLPRIEFSAPPEFHGEAGLWTPEHLFLASIVSCYVATFRAIAENSHFEFEALAVAAEGTLEKDDAGLRFTTVLLRPILTVGTEEHRERAVRLLAKAERGCLIARSVSSSIVLLPTVEVNQLALAGREQTALPA